MLYISEHSVLHICSLLANPAKLILVDFTMRWYLACLFLDCVSVLHVAYGCSCWLYMKLLVVVPWHLSFHKLRCAWVQRGILWGFSPETENCNRGTELLNTSVGANISVWLYIRRMRLKNYLGCSTWIARTSIASLFDRLSFSSTLDPLSCAPSRCCCVCSGCRVHDDHWINEGLPCMVYWLGCMFP